jgi:hypothetical protein
VTKAAIDPFGCGGREKQRNIVAALGVPRGEDFAGSSLLQHPLQRLVAVPPKVGSHTRPVEMHVDAERGRRRVVAEAALLPADLGEIEAAPTEFLRHVDGQVARFLQLVEIFPEEPVLGRVAASLGEAAGICGERTGSASALAAIEVSAELDTA